VLFEQIINGIVLGSMYALIAQGYTLVFGVLDKLNFAHSEIFMLGGFIAVSSVALGAPLPLTLLITIGISGLLGLVVEFVGFRKFRSHDAHITAALSSFAIGLVIIDLTQKMWGTEAVAIALPDALRIASIEILGIRIVLVKLGILALSLLLMLVLQLVVVRTNLGRSIRAVAESSGNAALYGINVTRITQLVFVIASALAGVAGMALTVRTGYADTATGFTFGL
jgi:branched-chain amino acid transport system permease protein